MIERRQKRKLAGVTYPTDLKYTNDHEWLRSDGSSARVGITQFAVEQLGDITLVDLPKIGDRIVKGERFGTVESVKSVSDLFAPVSGKVTRINEALLNAPELVNQEPYGQGWMVELGEFDSQELAGLLDVAAYAKLVENQ